jgi:hypothetical protein
MRVEVLYFQGCPNREPTVERLLRVLVEEDVCADIFHVEVPDNTAAQKLAFRGSPSIQINGVDLETSPEPSGSNGLCCRTYLEGSVREGIPPIELIRRAVRNARESGDESR